MSPPTQALDTPTTTQDGDAPAVVFPAGLPGFPGPRSFGMFRWGASEGPYSVLVDLDDPSVRFLVVPPAAFFPEYVVDVDDVVVQELDLQDADECLLLVIVTLGERASDATANLLGPLVINTRTRRGRQAVLADSPHGTRVPLARAA